MCSYSVPTLVVRFCLTARGEVFNREVANCLRLILLEFKLDALTIGYKKYY